MFTLRKATGGNKKYNLLRVAISDYVVARFALSDWNFATAHQLISQSIEKFIKLILTINDRGPKKPSRNLLIRIFNCIFNIPRSTNTWGHNHKKLLRQNRDIELFERILNDPNYMELINELGHKKFIATRYGEYYLKAEYPILLDTLDGLVKDFLYAIPHGPKTKKITVHERHKEVFLKNNKFFKEEDITIIKL